MNKVLVIGGGGREHAIVHALSRSSQVDKIYAAPGNVGIAHVAQCVHLKDTQVDELLEFAKKEEITLTVVGPEASLALGIVDKFTAAGLTIFGPTQAATRIESSKEYAKELMKKYKVPTADYQVFEDYEAASAYIHNHSLPIVLKYDGLAAGKGVVVAETMEQAEIALEDMLLDQKFGKGRVVIEEFLTGPEFSFMCFVSDDKVYPMVVAQDHKRAYDGDRGPNTGGMGSVSPNPFLGNDMDEVLMEDILKPFIKGLKEDHLDYRGCIFIGLMIKDGKAKVLEFNVRFGDPETQSIVLRLESDLLEIMYKTAIKELKDVEIKWNDKTAVCLVLASEGYPGSYQKGMEITGLDKLDDEIVIFHAGTKMDNGVLKTNGGRVLNVCALGDNLEDARDKVYAASEKIEFNGKYCRKDIGLN